MARKPTDPRTVILAKQITEIALRKGLSQNKLTEAAGVKANQWSAVLHGKVGISNERLHNAAAEVGAVLALMLPDDERPAFLGTVTTGGRVHLQGTDRVLPAYIAVDEACGDWRAGDEVLIVEGGFAPGEQLLIEGPNGLFFADAFERNGEPRLKSMQGESFDFEPSLHRVIGVVDSFKRKRRRPVHP